MSAPLRYRKNRTQPQPMVSPYNAQNYAIENPIDRINVHHNAVGNITRGDLGSYHNAGTNIYQRDFQSNISSNTPTIPQTPTLQYTEQYMQAQQYAQQYAKQYAIQHNQQLSPQYIEQYAQKYAQYTCEQMISSQSQTHSPQPRIPREYNREDRLGKIVSSDSNKSNQNSIEKLLIATRPHQDDEIGQNTSNSRYRSGNAHTTTISVTIKLPSRQVSKSITYNTKVKDLASQLVREHRLEFDFEEDEDGEDLILLWECIDGTRRPLREYEVLAPLVQKWGNKSGRYLRTTSTSLRNDVDSLASLVPRRDMLRTPPTLLQAEVHFSRPSIMYNPHQAHIPHIQERKNSVGSIGGRRGSADSTASGNSPNSHLKRIPSKLNPSDECLNVAKAEMDEELASDLEKRLVWGFGSADLMGNRIILKQKPGDELVSSSDTSDIDVYEWPHAGPKKYSFVLRSQRNTNQAIYISTDSAKAFSVIRNAVFTARSKILMTLK